MITSLVPANLHFLRQAVSLLTQLSDDIYSTPVMSFHGSTIGGHIRHCLEHYQSFIDGLDGEGIDYDLRQRRRDVECESDTAKDLAETLIAAFESRTAEIVDSAAVDVRMDCGQDGKTEWQTSTLGRELQFLVSHTVHHFAMIGGMCQMLDVETIKDFGVAPSTIRHRATSA